MASTNKSLSEININGDINVSEGQLGQTVFKSLTGNSIMTPGADFNALYNKYVIDADDNYNLTLPIINGNTGTFVANEVQIGFECIIANYDDTNTLNVIENSTSTTMVFLLPGNSAKLIAKSDGGGIVPDEWVVMQISDNNIISVTNTPEIINADDIVTITNDGIIKANSAKMNQLVSSHGNLSLFNPNNYIPSKIATDQNGNIYYFTHIDATTTIGTDQRGNSVIITPPVDPPVTLVFVKATRKNEIIWYREFNFPIPSAGTYFLRNYINYDDNNNIIWYCGNGFVSGDTTGVLSLLAHPYTSTDSTTKPFNSGNFASYVIGFDANTGLSYSFDTCYALTTTEASVGIIELDIDGDGNVHMTGVLNVGTDAAVFPNIGTNINITDKDYSANRGLFIAKYIPQVGFERIIVMKGSNGGDDKLTEWLFIDNNDNNALVLLETDSTVSWTCGRLYISGSGDADTPTQITVTAANNPCRAIIKIDKNTYNPVEIAVIENGDTGQTRNNTIYDRKLDQIVIFDVNNSNNVDFYNGFSGTIGSSVFNLTGTYHARLDNTFTWIFAIQTDSVSAHCFDTENNIIMLDYTSNNITLGGINYPSGGFINAKVDTNGNYLFSRRLSGNDIESNYLCPLCDINNNDTYYFHSGIISSNLTENGITLNTQGGNFTQLFTYFIDSANSPLGISTIDVAINDTAYVIISGKYSMQNNVLIKGNEYFNNFGDLTKNPIVKYKIGKAISSTDIIVNFKQ